MSATSLYDVLGVASDATDEEIKLAFRKLAIKCHPDKCDTSETGDQFSMIRHAYETLSDANRRAIYDALGDSVFSSPGASMLSKTTTTTTRSVHGIGPIHSQQVFSVNFTRKQQPSMHHTSATTSTHFSTDQNSPPNKRPCFMFHRTTTTTTTGIPHLASSPNLQPHSSPGFIYTQPMSPPSSPMKWPFSHVAVGPRFMTQSPPWVQGPKYQIHLPAGSTITLQGLGEASDELRVTICGFDPCMGRYTVCVPGIGAKKVLPQNIAEVGLDVHLRDTGDVSLDGHVGRITGFEADAMKYHVQLRHELDGDTRLLDPTQIALAPGTMAMVVRQSDPFSQGVWGHVDVLNERGEYLVRLREGNVINVPPRDLKIATAGL